MDYYDRLEPEVFRRTVELLGAVSRVVEIGCGDCRLGNFIARTTGCAVVGVDIDEEPLASARRKSRNLKVDHLVRYVKHNAENLDSLCPPKFDCCVSIYVLHELKHPLLVLKQVRKALTRNGKILLIDFPRGSKAEQLYDEEYYSTSMMRSFLSRAGFKNIHLEFFKHKQLALLSATV